MSDHDNLVLTESEQWLVDFLTENTGGKIDASELLDADYFEQELLDSLGIVQLIVGLENRFSVRLDAAHMQDPRFCTIRGLGQIIDELRA